MTTTAPGGFEYARDEESVQIAKLTFKHSGSLCSRKIMVAQMVKRLSTIRETWVRSLGQEDPLEKEMAIHSSTIAWKIL